jgi:hypothetical protein
MQRLIVPMAAALGMALALSACTDPYDPGQRAVGGGLLGAGTGAAIGGLAGGGATAAAGVLRTAATAARLLPATAAAPCLLSTAPANAVHESRNTATGAPRTGASARNSPPMVG